MAAITLCWAMLVSTSSVSATFTQSVNTECNLRSTAPGEDKSCAAAVTFIDTSYGVTEAIENTVTFTIIGECLSPRVSYKYRENDFDHASEYIDLYLVEGGASYTHIARCGENGRDENCDFFATCADQTPLLSYNLHHFEFFVVVSPNVDGLFHFEEDGEICPGGFSVESTLTLTCQASTKASTTTTTTTTPTTTTTTTTI